MQNQKSLTYRLTTFPRTRKLHQISVHRGAEGVPDVVKDMRKQALRTVEPEVRKNVRVLPESDTRHIFLSMGVLPTACGNFFRYHQRLPMVICHILLPTCFVLLNCSYYMNVTQPPFRNCPLGFLKRLLTVCRLVGESDARITTRAQEK